MMFCTGDLLVRLGLCRCRGPHGKRPHHPSSKRQEPQGTGMDEEQLRLYIKGFLATPSNPKHLMKNRIALKKYFMNSMAELKAFVEGEVNEEIKKPTPKKKAVKKTDSEDK